jgi:hypothetical protein
LWSLTGVRSAGCPNESWKLLHLTPIKPSNGWENHYANAPLPKKASTPIP